LLVVGAGKEDPFTYLGTVVDGNFQKGCSGAPVFFRTKDGKRWLFGGLVSAMVPQINKVIIVKPDEVLRKLAAFFDLRN
jgi:hypothetical protein